MANPTSPTNEELSVLRTYKFEVYVVTPFAKRIGEFLTKADLGEMKVLVREMVTFKSYVNKPATVFRDHVRSAYEQAGGEVVSISGGEIV